MSTIRVDQIYPVAEYGRPKGFVPYVPKGKSKTHIERIQEIVAMLRRQDALPVGPRQIGYRLKEAYRGEYVKKNEPGETLTSFKSIETFVKRLCQARALKFSEISDASAVIDDPGGWDSMAEFLAEAPEWFERDRRGGQQTVLEIGTEAKETLGLIRRLGAERGVLVYSGSGSSGPGLALKTARRALIRAVDHGQSTHLCWLGDFDQSGISTIVRPHMENIGAFLYGLGGDYLVNYKHKTMADTGCTMTFEHLGLSPEMALARAETAELTAVDQRKIRAYRDSGTDVWSRDLALLRGAAKFELEAVNPADLRSLVTGAIDQTLNRGQLEAIAAKGQIQRETLAARLGTLASELDEDEEP